MLTIIVTGDGLHRFSRAVRTLGEKRARVAFSRAINRVGRTVGNEAGRALADQTGLPRSTGKRAVTRHVVRSLPATLSYTIHGKGGNISLRYFKARETRKGVSAAPWNKRQVFPSTFMKAGWWPNRVTKPNWNKQVFERTGIFKKTDASPAGMDQFRVVKSGVFIPHEMVQGQVAATWTRSGRTRLQPRILHEIKAMTKGVVS